ncbi:hypothetical protein OG407_29025 [Streptomyces sp. NBC_01515]|uniref:hypothetical protein n=1 Tax=Streptomyces sp. NBC_01515 TaxID=2903890 RepID=UPI003866BC62
MTPRRTPRAVGSRTAILPDPAADPTARFFGQDDTFGQLADAVGASRDTVDERGAAELRIAAARALLSLADRVPVRARHHAPRLR